MILVIDNYDSFVYNLVHYLADLGAETRVVRNDEITTAEALGAGATGIVLSPGPCTPNEAGICLSVIDQAPQDLPIFGVCLGHQAIGQALGGRVVAAKTIMHGKVCDVRHTGEGLFAGLPSPLRATRYHSLAVARAGLPDALRVDAETDDGEIMAFSHRTRPIVGVQFHPESIASEHGRDLVRAFLAMTRP